MDFSKNTNGGFSPGSSSVPHSNEGEIPGWDFGDTKYDNGRTFKPNAATMIGSAKLPEDVSGKKSSFSTSSQDAPKTYDEVQQSIMDLYSNRHPSRIASAQSRLQAFQRSSEGWNLAERMLHSDQETVRFFGALTYMVKLNQGRPLADEERQTMLFDLVSASIEWLNIPSSGSMGIRKMCSTLVTFWMHFPETWERPIRYLAHCLYYSLPNPSADAIHPLTAYMIRSMREQHTNALLWFSNTLVEEVCKADQNNIKNHHFHERLQLNAEDIVQLVSVGICDESTPMKLRQECMICYQSWVTYSHKAYIDADIVLNPLKALLRPALSCLSTEDLFIPTAELFSELLTNHTKFLTFEELGMILDILISPWASKYYERLLEGDFESDSLQFGYLMLAFAGATIPELALSSAEPAQYPLFDHLKGLLKCKGLAVVEDHLFVPTLEFWTSFAEWVLDTLYDENEDKKWIAGARTHIIQVIELCWLKIQFPSEDDWKDLDSAEKTNFNDARRDVSDLLECSYTLTGSDILTTFANFVSPAVDHAKWAELESSLFCLASLADCIAEIDRSELSTWSAALDSIFNSNLFIVLSNPTTPVPKPVRMTCLMFISRYTYHFQSHPQYIAATIAFLFQMMEFPEVAKGAASTVQTLCSMCRLYLVPQLDAFIQHFGNVAQTTVLDSVVKDKIIGSIAHIIEALPTEEAKIIPIELLLQFVDQDANFCLTAAHQSNVEEASTAGESAMRGLYSIAKGLQAPDDFAIDLEQEVNQSSLWIDGAGAPVQKHIIALIRSVMDTLPNSSEVIEVACHIFRAGFAETVPGPFLFSPQVITQFIIRGNLETPRPDFFISTACSFVNSYRHKCRIDIHVAEILNWLVGILEWSTDVDISANGIEYFNALMPDYINILIQSLSPQATEKIFNYTITTLAGREPIPRAVACDFWSNFLIVSDKLDSDKVDPTLQALLKSIPEHMGPLLAEALINNIGGNCPRSGLDKVCEPLRKLVVKQMHCKKWLEAALFKQTFPSDRVDDNEKRMFLQKIVNLRGAKGTNKVVLEFYLQCRGLSWVGP